MPSELFGRLFSTTIGYDQLASFVDRIDLGNYPPYNIEKVIDYPLYALTMAVSGFTKEELDVSLNDSSLIIKGQKKSEDEDPKTEFVHRGLSFRNFKREWQLGKHVEVKSVSLKDGLLVVMLEEKEPEYVTKKFDIN